MANTKPPPPPPPIAYEFLAAATFQWQCPVCEANNLAYGPTQVYRDGQAHLKVCRGHR